ncbi:MAG: hypothetical protein WC263_04730 [Candidatus Micrarchaeia archaeon]|jgi:hypothetical protein
MKQKENGKPQLLAVAAAMLVLLSAMIDARLSFALAIAGLFAVSFLVKDKFWRQLPFILASIMIAAVVVVALNSLDGPSLPGLAIAGLVGAAIIALAFYRRKSGAILNDERTIAVHNRAMAYSWWVSYVMIAILFWFDYSDYLKLTAIQFGGVVLFTMLLSQLFIKRYLLSRGDC